MIHPTIGRVVWFRHNDSAASPDDQPLAAMVCYVHSDACVNLSVIDKEGNHFPRTSVRLRQPEDHVPFGMYCEWMPFQIATAKAA